ncbi:RNase H family protein [Lentibacillus sp. CBA3610]|uniref:RNase H family protein n=1 Tax=Lentibacillus sp. CBA3610 TaxID=2518176 RepID=UPI001595A439|nr:RNase H family protein [Lentibacillus sp. CBA3610]
MRQKNYTKSVSALPDFWGKSKEIVEQEHKDWIYDQYLSQEVLTIYCDASINKNNKMAAGFCYVYNGSVSKKYQLISGTGDFAMSVFAEITAIIGALQKFRHNVKDNYSSVLIYSDLDYIDDILSQTSTFKHTHLKEIQKELVFTFKQTCLKYPDLEINISPLTRNQKRYNPFLKAAHNAARELIM